ncbi:APH(3') family aminoglycoside O-phosphotransferase [Paenibacillus allorhizosphaerae]|uniref:Aminoglycoside 3'-phosphotransferase n=1 Tax=Paenibacillus allorhizosphaerae TaxID=2849866 RepID=A0ABN7TIU1_9BACL|nr:APH(3') family aminoglycoside O-phosphotransferase [Paenibacillus allorhizosphaerae]CAG7633835.1 Aminoglycoside 3'-phosphotransferase [Paenibacillus allorhizosphaerae]
MQIESYIIPSELSSLVIADSWEKIDAPYSGAATYRLEQATGEGAYLKILPVPHREPLEQYLKKLKWLKGKLNVPEVIYYAKTERFELLLMSEMIGIDGSSALHKENPEQVVRNLAEGLKEVHRIGVQDCPFDCTLAKRLERIKQKVDRGTINKEKLEKEFSDNFDHLYQALMTNTPSCEELVFTHGDYSAPNVMIHQNAVSGFVDLADAGISDKYRDLSAAYYSIIRNYGQPWTNVFFDEYGLSTVDQAKIEYYDLLEAFDYD